MLCVSAMSFGVEIVGASAPQLGEQRECRASAQLWIGQPSLRRTRGERVQLRIRKVSTRARSSAPVFESAIKPRACDG